MIKKTVIITGGSQGIGLACCEIFQQNDYQVINLDICKPKNQIGAFISVDLSDVEAIKSAFLQIKQQYKSIDALVANAGIHLSANIENTSKEDYYKVLNTNLSSCFFSIQQTIPLMKEKGGRIITLGSDQSFIAKPNAAIYGLTKAAIAQLTKTIALDYANDNILANCVCPGTIDTPLYRKAIANYCQKTGNSLDDVHKEEANQQPIKRLGSPQEVADLIFYLINDASPFILGSSITIDGGYTAR